MIINLLKKLFGSNIKVEPENIQETMTTAINPTQKSGGFRAEVKEKFGFDLPSADTEKISLGRKFEEESEIEKACACYEGCVRNGFEGNGPYDRLIILYRKLNRPKDVIRIIKKAISVFEKVSKQGRSDGQKKLEKYQEQLKKELAQ